MNANTQPDSTQRGAAILFVHGILGSPGQFERFMPLIPEGWTVRNLTLKGHSGTVKDFSAASMTEWRQQVSDALGELRPSHGRIFITAHSMGTLFALQEALREPVNALFLLNVPLKIRLTTQLARMSWGTYRGKPDPDDAVVIAAMEATDIAPDKNIFHYVGWIPRFLELFGEIRRTKRLLAALPMPCYAYLSAKDEVVSPRSARLLRDRTGAEVTMLTESGHFCYSTADSERLLGDFRRYIACPEGE